MKRIFNEMPSLEEITEGIEITLDNAIDLQSTAELLYKKKKYNHAVSFTLTAKQEMGKIKVLHYLTKSISAKKGESKRLTTAFFTHLDKITLSDVISSTTTNKTIRELIEVASGDHPKLIEHNLEKLDEESFRQRSLYVDYIKGQKKWHRPDSITQKTAEDLIHETQKIIDRVSQEKKAGFYTLKYYKFIAKYQVPLFLRYIDSEGNLKIPENELESLQDYWRKVIAKAKKEGIIAEDVHLDRKF